MYVADWGTREKSGHSPRFHQTLAKPCIVVNPDLSVENVTKLFVNNHLLRAPVIQGQLLGIISISDILMRSNVVKQLDKVFPGQNLHEAVQQARAVNTTDDHPSKSDVVGWEPVEEKLSQLLQQHGEKVLETALEEYFNGSCGAGDRCPLPCH